MGYVAALAHYYITYLGKNGSNAGSLKIIAEKLTCRIIVFGIAFVPIDSMRRDMRGGVGRRGWGAGIEKSEGKRQGCIELSFWDLWCITRVYCLPQYFIVLWTRVGTFVYRQCRRQCSGQKRAFSRLVQNRAQVCELQAGTVCEMLQY